ncbi:MAG: YnbE family lipoprotein [Pseudomonadota bacterium]
MTYLLPLSALLLIGLAACTPRVAVEAPQEPITINLNIKADVRVRIEEAAQSDIDANPDIFGTE